VEQPPSSTDDHLSPAATADIERPKSPWTPSFQVTTVGRGVSTSDEDQADQTTEVELVEDVPVIQDVAAVEVPADESETVQAALDVPQVVAPSTEEEGQGSDNSALPTGIETPQVSSGPDCDDGPFPICFPVACGYFLA
jgi:hypothetical protein